MPPLRRRAKRRNELDRMEHRLLTTGVACTTRFGVPHRLRDRDGLQALWNELRDDLIDEWVSEHPFSRPFGWLLFDITKPRLAVEGEAALESAEWFRTEDKDLRRCYFLGINRKLGIEDDSHDAKAAFESEKQYLIRIGALTETELALL